MKGTEHFKVSIESHLNMLASKDELFAVTLDKENKSIDECVSYIIEQVKASGMNGFASEDIYAMAVHYYDEDDIKVKGGAYNGKIVVDHPIKLTDKEKSEAKESAIRELIVENKNKLRKPKKEVADKTDKNEQASLFG